jgi:hypothetical protein
MDYYKGKLRHKRYWHNRFIALSILFLAELLRKLDESD